MHFQDMPGFYRDVDAVLSNRDKRGCRTAGDGNSRGATVRDRHPVGHFPRIAREAAGSLLRSRLKLFPPRRCIEDNPAVYRDKRRAIQEAAQKYSTGNIRSEEWIELIEAPRRGPG